MLIILSFYSKLRKSAFRRGFNRSFNRSNKRMEVFTHKANRISGVSNWEVQREDYDFHQEIARSAFADMLHDTERNQKYFNALKQAIDKMHKRGLTANVLDIGTGTGLLSIMAVRCGADSVTACEAFKPMAQCALKVIENNNAKDKIKVVPKRSTEMTVGEGGDMEQKANILVTEVFDTELIGEGAIGTFSHAHKYLLQQDCIVVPDSAVIYAQIVECPTLHKWNKLNDLTNDDNIILKIPPKMKNCAGSAAVHDIQLNQLPKHSFIALSEPVPALYYDWSGKSPIDKVVLVKQVVTATNTGKAQLVFMWWELNMDTEGKIVINCAPWWHHPETDLSARYPQDTVPWRDHWMQAVYYFPKEIQVTKGSEINLVSSQDEYSLWFLIESEFNMSRLYKRPICECGIHMMFSRTHVSYLNDGKRTKKFLNYLRENLNNESIVLNLNGSSLLGLAAAKMVANHVYYLESNKFIVDIMKEFVSTNGIANVEFLSEVSEGQLRSVTHVICDPNFTHSILPWDNLRMAYLLYNFKTILSERTVFVPSTCIFWAMPVKFLDLHKIRQPLKNCEGIDMTEFDKLIERSRSISDEDLEAQPLWEYPCFCVGEMKQLLTIDMNNLKQTYTEEGRYDFADSSSEHVTTINGFAIWASWKVGEDWVCGGPTSTPQLGQRLTWDMHTRQAVKILTENYIISKDSFWTFKVNCDLENGEFNLKIDFSSS